MKDKIITTIPLEPRDEIPKLGILSSAIFADFIARRHPDTSLRVALNVLESNLVEKPRYLKPFLDSLNYLGIPRDKSWVDSENTQRLMENIYKFQEAGSLRESNKPRLISPSKRVELLKDIYHSPRSRFYEQTPSGYRSKITEEYLAETREKSLILKLASELPLPRILPKMMEKEAMTHINRLQGMEMLVSRERDTNLKYSLRGKSYFLDTDLIWSQFYNNLMDDKSFGVIVGSNHTAWQSCLAYAMHKTIQGEDVRDDTALIFMPYICNPGDCEDFIREGYLYSDPNISRLAVLNSYSSTKKDVSWQRDFLSGKISRKISRLPESQGIGDCPDLTEDSLCKTLGLIKKQNIELAVSRNSLLDEGKCDIRGMCI